MPEQGNNICQRHLNIAQVAQPAQESCGKHAEVWAVAVIVDNVWYTAGNLLKTDSMMSELRSGSQTPINPTKKKILKKFSSLVYTFIPDSWHLSGREPHLNVVRYHKGICYKAIWKEQCLWDTTTQGNQIHFTVSETFQLQG